MELLAEEIEDPFGSDENDLPTDSTLLEYSKQLPANFWLINLRAQKKAPLGRFRKQ